MVLRDGSWPNCGQIQAMHSIRLRLPLGGCSLTRKTPTPKAFIVSSCALPVVTAAAMLDKNTLFALSLFPYLGFLWFMTRTQATPRLALVGFYALLVFVAVTIPAGIYAKVGLQTELANVDWLHGGAESFLTLSNILVVLGFRQAVLRQRAKVNAETTPSEVLGE